MDKEANILYENIKQQKPFCFIKLNDGECNSILNKDVTLSRGFEQSDSIMSNKLRECLLYEDKNYYKGLPCNNCYKGMRESINEIIKSKSNSTNIFNANCLINSNTDKTINIIKTYLPSREIIIVASEEMVNNINELEKLNIIVSKCFQVTNKNAFKNNYDSIKDKWREINNNSVVICLCGPLGRILCKEWYENNNSLTCLELGSFFDPLINNKSYLYHTGTLHYCDICNPTNSSSDCLLIDLIPNKIYKECYYFNNFETALEFYRGNIEKTIKNFNNILYNDPNYKIPEPKENKLDKYKKLNKEQLFNICNDLYEKQNFIEYDVASKLYLDYFKEINDKEKQKIIFLNGCRNFNTDKEKAICDYETLYNDNECDEEIRKFTGWNLDMLYPKNNESIPKIVHLIYFKERELELYNYVCILSMIQHMKDYSFVMYNDIEPTENIYWQKLKNNSKIDFKKHNRPKEFDGFDINYVQYAADITRLELLYEYGGIYMDLDMLILKNFDNLIKNKDFYISYESGKDDSVLINSILISKPKNEFIKIWLDSFKTGLRMNKWAYHISKQNKYLLDTNKSYLIKYNIEILDSKYFFNFRWTDIDKFQNIKDNITQDMYGIHLFDTILKDTLKNNIFFDKYKLIDFP